MLQHLVVGSLGPLHAVLGVHCSLIGFELPLRKVGSIVNPADLVGVRCHFSIVNTLVFIQFGLIDASFGIEPILEQVALLVELLVDISSFDQVTFDKALMDTSIKVLSLASSASSIRRCHKSSFVVQIRVLWYELAKVNVLAAFLVEQHTGLLRLFFLLAVG